MVSSSGWVNSTAHSASVQCPHAPPRRGSRPPGGARFPLGAARRGNPSWGRSNRQATQASALKAELERATQSGDAARVQRVFGDLREQFGGTTYAQQGALMAAQSLLDAGKAEEAQAALRWVIDKAGDEGYQAVARLRLAAVLGDARKVDEALQLLSTKMPPAFEGLAADRRGDLLQLQGKKAEALVQYQQAWKAVEPRSDIRRLIEIKVAALGGELPTEAGPGASGASTAASASR